MSSLIAAQHFFTSVPAKQSPKKRRGYQTLFYTRGLSDVVVRAIEDRAQYATGPGDPVKRQFYQVPGEFTAISQTVALTELDEFGRKGRYLTHTFILDMQSFQQISICPTDVFRQVQFATTLDEVFRQGELETGRVPAITLNIKVQWIHRATQSMRNWNLDQLMQLGRLAWQAPSLHQKREVVTLTGSESEKIDALELLFFLAPPKAQAQLSFDTYAVGCNWPPSVSFHILGYPDRSEARKISHWVDAHNKKVESPLSPGDDGPFGIWTSQVLKNEEAQKRDFYQRQIWVERLSDMIIGKQPAVNLPISQIPSSLVQSFACINTQAITSRWLSYLPSDLSQRFLQGFLDDITAHPDRYLEIINQGVDAQQIDDFLLDLSMSLRRAPEKNDQKILKRWIKSRNHSLLEAFLFLWTKNKRGWRKSLSSLSQQNYAWLIDGLKSWPEVPISLDLALVEPHASTWIRAVGPSLPPTTWQSTLSDLYRMEEHLLPIVAEIAPFLSLSAKKEIARWVKKSKAAAPELRSVLGLPEKEKRLFGLF